MQVLFFMGIFVIFYITKVPQKLERSLAQSAQESQGSTRQRARRLTRQARHAYVLHHTTENQKPIRHRTGTRGIHQRRAVLFQPSDEGRYDQIRDFQNSGERHE